MTTLLAGKNAVIYGAAGGIGRTVARTFVAEGARVYLAGRTAAKVQALAAELRDAGGQAEAVGLDAIDEPAVVDHLDHVVREVGSVDVSLNLVSRGDVQGQTLLDISVDDFMQPVETGPRAAFITSRAAARHMVRQQAGGAVLYLTSGSSGMQGPGMGGTGATDGAIESYMRALANECGPQGVRVYGIWTAGVTDVMQQEDLTAVDPNAPTVEQLDAMISGMALLRRAPKAREIADAAAFLASDRASGMTTGIANVTCGLVTG
jgi:NAD(P)-dependent dehydrogenase (short-subunit alcohol dehydrogenase family)